MKILVTGATGFIGSHLVRCLIRNGYEVVGTYRTILRNEVNGCRYIHINLAKEDLEENEAYDCVIHCAGQVEEGMTWDYIENSIISTKRLMQYCEKMAVKKFIFMSSIAVYGECSGQVDENADHINQNKYALCKTLCEGIVEDSTIKCKYIIRLSRILGEGGFESGGFLTNFAKAFINDETVRYSNGNILYNNMFYITDLENVCILLIEKMQEKFWCIGVGGSAPLKLSEIVYLMKKCLHSSSQIIEIEKQDRLTCHLIDTKRLFNLGYQALSVEEIITKFCADAIDRFSLSEKRR